MRTGVLAVTALVVSLGVVSPLEAQGRSGSVPIAELWTQAVTEARAGELETASATVGRLTDQARALGILRLPLYAKAAASLAFSAAESQDEPLSDWALTTAELLDPESPSVPLVAAEIARLRGDWQAVVKAALESLSKISDSYTTRVVAQVNLLIGFLATIVLTALVFPLILLLRYGSAAAHDFRELLATRFSAGVATVLGFGLLFLPVFLWLGPLWLFFYWMILLFGYASLGERAAIIVLLLALALVPLPLDWSAHRLAGVDIPPVSAAVASVERSYDPDTIRRLRELVTLMPEEAELHLLLGNLIMQEGSEQDALIHYLRAGELDPQLAGVQLNIGNLYFLGGDYSAALVRYARASEINPQMAIAWYNQSVAAGEQYSFERQGEALERAKAADRALIEKVLSRPPGRKIVWYYLPVSRAWALARGISVRQEVRSLFGSYRRFEPLRTLMNPLSAGAGGALLLILLVWSLRRRSGLAGACVKCGRTFCPRCKSARESETYCTQCIHIYLKRDGVSLETKRRKLDEVSRHQSSSLRTRKLLTTILPGSGPLLAGSAWKGLLVLMLFLLFVSAALLAGRLAPVATPSATIHFVTRITAIALAILIWLAASIPVYRERAAG